MRERVAIRRKLSLQCVVVLLDATFTFASEAASIELLMQRYADTPMSLADACLVRLSEVHKDCRVLTLDKHSKHYRRFGRSVIPLISPS